VENDNEKKKGGSEKQERNQKILELFFKGNGKLDRLPAQVGREGGPTGNDQKKTAGETLDSALEARNVKNSKQDHRKSLGGAAEKKGSEKPAG